MRAQGFGSTSTAAVFSVGHRGRGVRAITLQIAILGLLAGLLPLLASLTPQLASKAHAATSCPGGNCTVTIDARDFASGNPLAHFNYIINLDNTKLPTDPDALSTESNSPIVREGDEGRNTVTLPEGNRYLVSVRAVDHKMWGAYFSLPEDANAAGNLTVRVDLTEQSDAHPLPLGSIRTFVFEDNAWANGAPDTEEAGLQGFKVDLTEETGSDVTVDYNNDPLCGNGDCRTNGEGFNQIDNLGPATYNIEVHPPDGPCNSNPDSQWYQTTTIDGGLTLLAPTEEGADGTGAPGEQLWEPPTARTAYWFGFVCAPQNFAANGTGEVTGQARNWQGWPPFDVLTLGDPVEDPFVALSDSTTDRTVFVGRGDAQGNFDIQNVPAGTYNLSIWDEQLTYIMRFTAVTVAPGQTVTVDDGDPVHPGEQGVGVSRWFGWLDGVVYKDLNANGVRDPGEPGVANTDMDQRWRDGSIKEATVTNPQGYYEYPTAEGGPLGRWIINEQGFARFGVTGASVHDEYDPSIVTHIPDDLGGSLLANQLLTEGHRATVDWGKVDYPAGTPGQIVGITYFSTTRNEFDARLQAHEDYEPAIPDVTVLLETLGPDGQPNTADDVVVNKYVTDHWSQPRGTPPANPAVYNDGCAVRDANGDDISGSLNPAIGPNCLEVPITGEQTKDGAFDGGYAFADYCPTGYDMQADDGSCVSGAPQPLVAGTYITHVIMPKDTTDTRACNPAGASQRVSHAKGSVPGDGDGCLYRPVREEDVNVDLGNHFGPQIPPPPCTGDDHVIDQSTLVARSNYFGVAGAHAPLCDKRLVVLQNGQNANADFNLMTNFITDPNGEDPNDSRIGDVAEPGRFVGQVFNDIYFERDPMSPWYGEPRPIPNIPVGIYARVDTTNGNVNAPYSPDNWRLLTTVTTSADGSFEALLPSTETFNCPIPQGPCPGMYLVKVDDPGSKEAPNANYDPNLLTATTPASSWPGLTTQLDLPLDPISGTGCEDPAVPARPEILQVSTPYVPNNVAANGGNAANPRDITIQADFIGTTGAATGATGVRATLTDLRSGTVTTLTRANGGIQSWVPGNATTPDTIRIRVPALSAAFPAGQKQLQITTANINGGVSSVNGLTIHALGTGGGFTYSPAVRNVPAPPPGPGTDPHALQNTIDAAPAGALVVLRPGVYNENVVVWKPLKIQGLGPGGIVGAHELLSRDPEDPRGLVKGSVVDGRYFQQNAAAYDAVIAAHGPYAGADASHPVLRGADVTFVAQNATAYNIPNGANGVWSAARIDGVGLMTGSGEGAGGVQLFAQNNNARITNNVLEHNGGVVAGGIGVGQPYNDGQHNWNVKILNNRVLGNGGLTQAGGIGIFYGSNNYEVASNIVCSNFSVNYGAGVSHIGLSPNGSIHENQIYYNDSVDSGAGLAIESELPVGGGLGDGTGSVDVDRNLIQSNYSGDDAGGVFVLDALQFQISLRNNMIVDNGAADVGGAMMLDDSSNVRIINNTVANNVSTGSSEFSDGNPHSAGLASEANDPLFQAMLPAGSPDFSNPRALFNNIFWNNQAYTLDQPGPGAALVNEGFIDFEIRGTTNNADTFTPRYSDLTNGQILGPNGVLHALPGGQGNISVDPGFVLPFVNELTVTGSRLDPQTAAVTITGADPPVGLTGDYHVTAASGVVDRGVRCSNTAFPAPATALNACSAAAVQAPVGTVLPGGDYDGQYRARRPSTRTRTPWDLGADEIQAGATVALP
jgi:large repetitive protein